MKFAPLAPALTIAFALALAGCQQGKAPESNPESKPGMMLSGGRMVLPAVAGNPAAAYFMLTNAGEKDATLTAVAIEGTAKAEMPETTGGSMAALPNLAVDSSESVVFAQGSKHVMVFGVSPDLKAGGTTEITLTFSDGDKMSAPLTLEAAGAATMDHGAMN